MPVTQMVILSSAAAVVVDMMMPLFSYAMWMTFAMDNDENDGTGLMMVAGIEQQDPGI